MRVGRVEWQLLSLTGRVQGPALHDTSMTESEIRELLEGVRRGKVSPAKAVERLKRLPFEDLGFAKKIGRASCRERV